MRGVIHRADTCAISSRLPLAYGGKATAGEILERPGPVTNTARVTAHGAAYNYAAQLLTVVLQFGYAATTSRLLSPDAFGAYGGGLTIAGFIIVLAIAGLPQAVSRMPVLAVGRLSALLAYSVGVGAIAGLFTAFTGPFWAALLHIPQAAPVLAVMAVNVFFTPLLAVGTGVMLRHARFRLLAAITFGMNVFGMIVGVVAILLTHSPAALAVSATVGQGLAAVTFLILSRRDLVGRPEGTHLVQDVVFSGRLTGSTAVSYTAANVGKIFVSNTLGAVPLGHWNRADVITTVPFFQVQQALTQALYPQFRHDPADPLRARRIWADLLGLVAWVVVPAAAVLAAVSPVIVPVFFGDRWAIVALLAPPLAILGGVKVLFFVLVSALEVLERMRWVWAGHLVALGCSIAGGVVAAVERDISPAIAGALIGLFAMHIVHLVLCTRAGMLDLPGLLRQYAWVLVASVVLGASAFGVAAFARTLAPVLAIAALVVYALVCAGVVWLLRGRLPLFVIARKYGILGRA